MTSCCATEQWACSLEAALEAEAKAAKTTAAGVHEPAALAKLDEVSAAPGGAAEPLVGLLTTTGAHKVTSRVTNETLDRNSEVSFVAGCVFACGYTCVWERELREATCRRLFRELSVQTAITVGL